MPYQFDQETTPTRSAPGEFAGFINATWNIGDNPNGGYLVANALRAVGENLLHPHPLTVTAHFLRPGIPDCAHRVQVEVLREGRMFSTARATLTQQDKTRIETLTTWGDLDNQTGSSHSLSLPAPHMPPPEQCVQRSGTAQGIELPLLARLDIRIHPDHARAGTNQHAELAGFIRFTDGRPADALALALFVDAFPPSPFTLLGQIGWVPTVELTVHILRLPEPGWIQARLKTDFLHQGRMIESGCLWDSAGNLVAQSRQIGLVMAQ